MRAADEPQTTMFSYVSIEDRIPTEHPLRAIQALVNPVLAELSPRFQAMYARMGGPSIPSERLRRALLLQTLYTIRSEQQLMEQLDDNLLFRRFVGLNPDDAVWVPMGFTRNRDRVLVGHLADAFLHEILRAADQRRLLSHEHLTVDGTALEAWASQKSFRPKDDPTPPASDQDPKIPTVNFRQEMSSNAVHQSVADPPCRLAHTSQGTAAPLSHLGSVVMDNRHDLIVATDIRLPSGTAEREAGVEMPTARERSARRCTLGADKGYDARKFGAHLRACRMRPYVAMNRDAPRSASAVEGRVTRHSDFSISQLQGNLVDEDFGWSKTIGGVRKLHRRGREELSWVFTFTTAAYNLVRLRTLVLTGVCGCATARPHAGRLMRRNAPNRTLVSTTHAPPAPQEWSISPKSSIFQHPASVAGTRPALGAKLEATCHRFAALP